MQQYNYQNGYTAVAYPYPNQCQAYYPQQYSYQGELAEKSYLIQGYQNMMNTQVQMQPNAFPQNMMIPQMMNLYGAYQPLPNYGKQGKKNMMQINGQVLNNGQRMQGQYKNSNRNKPVNGLLQQNQIIQKSEKATKFLEIQTQQNKKARKDSDDYNYHSDASTSVGDNDQDSLSTNNSKTCTPAKQKSDEYYQEATVKKPKKQFGSEQERENFVRSYQIKFKTEMCRNWELFGKCKFQDKCSFAHGDHELHKKVHLPQNYKTKACIQFHTTSYCPYGNRCQFLHSQFDIYSGNPLSYTSILNENVRLSEERASSLKEGNELLTYVTVFPTRRLKVFEQVIPNQ